jgi:hypothetical protein
MNEKNKVRPLYTPDNMKKFLTILNQYPAIRQWWNIESGNQLSETSESALPKLNTDYKY